MTKVVYGVIGVLVVAVVILTGLVGYLYGQSFQTKAETITVTSQIATATTTTKTQFVTVTTTYATFQPSPYKIEVTTDRVNQILYIFIKLSAPPGNYSHISVYALNGENVITIFFPPPRAFLDNYIIHTDTINLDDYEVKEEYCTLNLIAQNGSIVYSMTTKFPRAISKQDFTRFEKMEITSAWATGSGSSGWSVYVLYKNTGSSDATITDVFINGKPPSSYGASVTVNQPTFPKSVTVGTGGSIHITIKPGARFASGQTIEVKIHTASGAEYPKAVVLP